MYKKVNITENHLTVLSLYTKGYESEYYIRQVSKELGISPRTSQLILADLEKKGVLISKQKGKTLLFSLNKQNPIAKAYVKLAEDYRLVTLLSKEPEVKQLLSEIEEIDDKTVFVIFGSYAKAGQKEGSDIDILAISEKPFKKAKLKALEGKHSFRISIKTANLKSFDKNDFLIKEVIENHICFQRAEDFIRLAWQ